MAIYRCIFFYIFFYKITCTANKMTLFSRRDSSINECEIKGIRVREKNSVTLTCPECGFEQREPGMAVSTYCRGCSTHYQILEGKAVPKKIRPSNPFASLQGNGNSPRLRDDNPSDASNVTTSDAPPVPPKPPSPNTKSAPSGVPAKKATATSFFNAVVEPRDVACFECDRIHQAPSEASSTLCPACGAYISLKDFDIKDNWNRGIQTRGNVTIHKKAAVTGITIRCHHLIAHGKLTGGVDCSGDVTIQSHGKIMGKVRCKRLIIEKRAHVEFSNPVQCVDAIIDGEVTGNFTCTGKLHLKKKATLSGDIKVATMAVDEGARHHGQISIGS